MCIAVVGASARKDTLDYTAIPQTLIGGLPDPVYPVDPHALADAGLRVALHSFVARPRHCGPV